MSCFRICPYVPIERKTQWLNVKPTYAEVTDNFVLAGTLSLISSNYIYFGKEKVQCHLSDNFEKWRKKEKYLMNGYESLQAI